MVKVTLDTNVLPADDLIAAVAPGKFDFAVVSVSEREMGCTVRSIATVPETGVWDESHWDGAVWADSASGNCLEQTLTVVGEGSFPPPERRAALTPGQRRQLRDAMIFCAHVRAQRAIFVTNDERGFIRKDRRAKLESMFRTRILTRQEFLSEFRGK